MQQTKQPNRHILIKPKDSERKAVSKLIDRALDSDYEVLVKLR